jgi:hypothetical protein
MRFYGGIYARYDAPSTNSPLMQVMYGIPYGDHLLFIYIHIFAYIAADGVCDKKIRIRHKKFMYYMIIYYIII